VSSCKKNPGTYGILRLVSRGGTNNGVNGISSHSRKGINDFGFSHMHKKGVYGRAGGGRHGIWDGRAVDMDGPLVPGRKSELNFDERNGGWMGCKYGDLL